MVFQCIYIRQVPTEVLKTAAASLGFQHLPRVLANVNAWKTMFDPYIERKKNTDQILTENKQNKKFIFKLCMFQLLSAYDFCLKMTHMSYPDMWSFIKFKNW